MTAARPTPAERALAVAIYAPIGLGAKVVDDVPDVLAKARQQLVFARFIGKIAVDQGVRELRNRLDGLSGPAPAGRAPQEPAAAARRSEAGAGVQDADVDAETLTAQRSVSPAPEALALPDYDQLPAAHIVSKLAGLTAAELDAVEVYESAHRHRRTVLGKISQLRGD